MTTGNRDKVRDVFDDWAASGRADRMATSHSPAARPAFDRLRLKDGERYLDVGCGNGYTVRWAAETCARATGLDMSPNMIARARELSATIGNVDYLVSPFPDDGALPAASFDAVFSMEVLYYLDDLGSAVRRVRELLRPGGRFACVVDFYAENTASHGWPDDLGVPMTLRSARGWRLEFEENGFEVVEQERLRQPDFASDPDSRWKSVEGSLLTLGVARV